MVIAIDAGHGGEDSGAVDTKRNMLEKDMALSTALTYKYFLATAGYRVLMSRSTDVRPSYRDRSSLGAMADLFISVHYNSMNTYGLIYHEKADPLALQFANIASRRLGLSRVWSTDVSRFGRLYIDDVDCPAIIHEVAAVSDYPQDKQKAINFRMQNAVRMLLAVEDYKRLVLRR